MSPDVETVNVPNKLSALLDSAIQQHRKKLSTCNSLIDLVYTFGHVMAYTETTQAIKELIAPVKTPPA